MKIHRPLIFAIIDILKSIYFENQMADKALNNCFRNNRKYGARDRAFIAENTYEIVRWWRLLHYINESDYSQPSMKDVWKVLGIRLRIGGYEMPEFDEFKGLNRNKIKERFEMAKSDRAVRESIPDWLDEIGSTQIGSDWDQILDGLNEEAKVGLRVNILKNDVVELQKILLKEGISTKKIKGVPHGLFLSERKNVFATQAFKHGHFEVQDPGSQLIGEFLGVSPDMRVIDACAGAGGKTLHIATLMQNKGTVISMDVEEWKLKELKRRAKRNGLFNIDTRTINNNKVVKRLDKSADRLLLDVPCTGTGVLRRNPDAKWKLDEDFLKRIMHTQQEILSNYSRMVKVGGELVYATCSVLPCENQEQVQLFLNSNSNFEFVEEKNTYPHKSDFDGFYMAKLRRTN